MKRGFAPLYQVSTTLSSHVLYTVLCVVIYLIINNMNVEIGNKPLKELTAEDLRQIVLIEGCSPSLEYWNEPEITDFTNTLFSDTIVIEYLSYRKEDNLKSCEYTFFFNFKDFIFHYEKGNPNHQPNGKRVGLETLRYLISQGFDVPLYNNA
jgi:hypothetical protein